MSLQFSETVELSDFLRRKNSLLTEELKNVQLKYEQQLSMNSTLEQFQSGMRLLSEKFPLFSLEKLMNRYEILEETSLNLTKKLAELEEEKRKTDADKHREIAAFQDQFMMISDNEKHREKELQEARNRLNNQKFDKDEALAYKEKYLLVFKRIIALFNKWSSKIKVYYNTDKNKEENVILDDPMNILDVLEKMVLISTPESLQNYLRKIIVAANKLQRNHFKSFVNERFDPEKIFERIEKKLQAGKSRGEG